MFKRALIALAVVAFAAGSAAAGPASNATVSKDKRITSIPHGTAHFVPAIRPPRKLDVIFDNIGFLYPKGLYFCCYGYTVSGPSSQIGQTIWSASGFTPSKDMSVKLLEVAVGYVSGTNKVVISIADDNGGVPGNILGSWPVTNLGTFGTCCALAQLNVDHIHVTAGQQYWVIVGTDDSDADTWAAWPFNSTDEIDPVPFAQYNDSSWTNYGGSIPGLSFAVYGKHS